MYNTPFEVGFSGSAKLLSICWKLSSFDCNEGGEGRVEHLDPVLFDSSDRK